MLSIGRSVDETAVAQKLLVVTARDMPISRWESGETSAEEVDGIGPSPDE
jgi:hypothetical protein